MTLEHGESATSVRELLASRGLAPNKRFGQNFLVDHKLLDLIVGLGEIASDECVLEVGVGTGSLTRRLAGKAGRVVAVEIDRGLHDLAEDRLSEFSSVTLIHADIMATKSTLDQDVCAALENTIGTAPKRRFKVVANLPYNVSTPFLSALLARFGAPARMVLLVQKELAQNLAAGPGSDAYSPLSILMAHLCRVTIDRVLPREVFWPRPQVDSAIVVIDGAAVDPTHALAAQPFVAGLFRERRKAIAGLLRRLPEALGGPLDAESVARVLDRSGLDGRARAESLTPMQLLGLYDAFRSVGVGGSE